MVKFRGQVPPKVPRQLVDTEPADLARFSRLSVRSFTGQDLAKVSWRDPVLVFARQAMVGNTGQRAKGDLDADFFASFADDTLLESFEEIHFAADGAPADSDAWMRFRRGCLAGLRRAPAPGKWERSARRERSRRRTARRKGRRLPECSRKTAGPQDSKRPSRRRS